MMKARIILCSVFLVFLGLGSVMASSPDEWVKHYKEVSTKCIKVSGFKNARTLGDPVQFDDTVGYDAVIVRGRYPQPQMNNAEGYALCLFNVKTRQAQCTEINNWFNPANTGK